MLRKALCSLYILVILVMAVATLAEEARGTAFVQQNVYGAWWFTVLWALLAAVSATWFVRRKVRRASLVILHLSFVVILIGALLTHVSSESGMIHLREGITTTEYVARGEKGHSELRRLPFAMSFLSFEVRYHEGTRAPSDYVTSFRIDDGRQTVEGSVSMNKVYTHGTIRLFQMSYDSDLRGSILSFNDDPFGTNITYTGYALLFLALLWMLFDPHGPYAKVVKNAAAKRRLLCLATLVILATLPSRADTAPTLPREQAEQLGKICVLHNDRICPLQTLAIDFTKKVYGKDSYKGLTAEQVLAGWIFFGNEWAKEEFVRVKGSTARSVLGLPKHVALNALFRKEYGGYILGPYVREYSNGRRDKLRKEIIDIDERLMLIMQLRRGTLMKVFPYTDESGTTTWLSPIDDLPAGISPDDAAFIKQVFSRIDEHIRTDDARRVSELIADIDNYQHTNAATSMPTTAQLRAETIYNALPFAKILFMVNLFFGFVLLITHVVGLCSERRKRQWTHPVAVGILLLSFLTLTFCEVLRYIIGGKVPMSNGYETMLFVAWLLMLTAIITCRRFHITAPCALLMSGFFLLVSHIGQMDPQIAHLMPVLNSPLLSIHVSVIMTAFALLSLTFICGITALAVRATHPSDDEQCHALQLLSQLFLYPALVALAFGIFIGAIWANISWGQYWSWDPKEVWALITFMVYAVAVHSKTIPALQQPRNYHIYIVAAFLTILMTYFGVNYVLGGMHSYA